MKTWCHCLVLASLMGGWALAAAQPTASASAAAASAPGPEAFYRRPDIEAVALSPSGRWLAMSTGLGGMRVGLVVFDLQQWKLHAQVARYVDADVRSFRWVNDDRLIYDVVDRTVGDGDRRWGPGLFSANRDGSDSRQLVQLNSPLIVNESRRGREPLAPSHRLLHVGSGAGDEIIVGEWRYDTRGEPLGVVAKRLNVLTGRAESLARGAPEHVQRWLFDPAREPRVVVTRHEGRQSVHWREAGDETWRVLASFDALSPPFEPRFIDSKGTLYVTALDPRAGTNVLTTFDFKTGQASAESVVRTPGFDFSGGLVSEADGGVALGVRVDTDAESTVWFDKRLAALQVLADQRQPGRVNRISCRRCDQADMTAVVYSYSDRDPGQFWIYTASDQAWRRIGAVRQGIDPQRMARADFFRIKARDGLEIPVWLTLPPGKAEPRPAVLLVHGGPWVRGGHWNWNADAQFLASRGYAVLEPEFRGSTGYGRGLFRAGWRQWGQAMQDDLADALAWAVEQRHVDPKRVCIAGASYGGYATLMGLVRQGDLFRCGVAWAAVTDPRLMFEWRYGTDQSDEVRGYTLPQLIGDPVKDAAMLEAVSPLAQAARIRAPLMLAIGGADRRVLQVHGNRLRDALEAAGRPPTWIEYPGEGHGWFKLETRLDFARRMEAFLAEHLH